MSQWKLRQRIFGRSGPRNYSASADAARRSMRARDHLERKRTQERRRRERERTQTERTVAQPRIRALASWGVFAAALTAGILLARPLNERIPFQSAAFERVDIQGTSALTPEEVVRVAGLHERRTADRFDVREVVRAVEAEPWIESARALRLPTGALMISVVERDAIAVWQLDAQSAPLLVDKTGEPFNGALEPGGPLPRVAGPRTQPEALLPAEAIEILETLQRFSNLSKDPRTLTLYLPGNEESGDGASPDEQTGYVLQLGNEGPKALLGRQLLAERVARLAALVDSGEPKLLSAQWIDLRYADRAVLRTEPVSG
jgi:cell division septal protein FtsQ